MKVTDFYTLETYLRTNNIFDQYGLKRIGVFGSLARGESFADIDLMIDENVSFDILVKMKEKIQSDLDTNVDILIRELAEPIILLRALKDMRYATRN